jgi:hypothetical protein
MKELSPERKQELIMVLKEDFGIIFNEEPTLNQLSDLYFIYCCTGNHSLAAIFERVGLGRPSDNVPKNIGNATPCKSFSDYLNFREQNEWDDLISHIED